VGGGLRVAVRLTPKGRKDGIEGVAETVHGTAEIRISVTAVPENGKANKALIKLLAKLWKLPKTGIRIISGETDRHKILELDGDAGELHSRIAHTLKI
jgi:uncharacterized protein (TIGR00251 family)